MSEDANRRNMEQAFAAFNRHDVEAIRGLLAEGYVDHEPPPELGSGFDATKRSLEALLAAFPDAGFEVLDMVADDSSGATRFRLTGTHEGEFMGIAPTGRPIDIEVVDFLRFDDAGNATEHWGYLDQLEMLRQLGAVPAELE